jgi:hypothetical protein
MRAAAFLSGDKNFIESCKGDVHSNNAKILFPKASAAGWLEGGPKCDLCKKDVRHTKGCSNPKGNPWLGKPFRDIAKNAGFGILYSAKTDTIFSFLRAKGFAVTMAQVQAMFDQIRQTYRGYYNYCADNLFQCNMKGFLRTELLGRIRWIGFSPAEGDPFNFTVQSFIADLMNLRLIELVRRTRGLGVRIVAQMHDALAVEVRKGKRARLCAEAIRQIWAEPIKILRNGLEMVMPIDFKVAERISDFG